MCAPNFIRSPVRPRCACTRGVEVVQKTLKFYSKHQSGVILNEHHMCGEILVAKYSTHTNMRIKF